MAVSSAGDQSFDHAVEQVREMLDEVEANGAAGILEATPIARFGNFEGLPVNVTFVEVDGGEGHRPGRLIDPITYNGPEARAWPVPGGSWLNGASIPRPLWPIVGSPYTGAYLEASIVHDHYCITKDRSWRDTHRMFHDAMRCSGVGKMRASVMFYAVYRFGPRWAGADTEGLEGLADYSASDPLDAVTAEELRRDAEEIAAHDPDVEEVAGLAEARTASSAVPKFD